jgi:hypothetical protein
MSNNALQTQINNLISDISSLDSQISTLDTTIQNLIRGGGKPSSTQTSDLAALKNSRATKAEQLSELQSQNAAQRSDSATAANFALRTAAGIASGITANSTGNTTLLTPSKNLSYNVPCVQDAYFSSRVSFLDMARFSSNKPAAVGAASDLWTSAKASKGMIVSHIVPGEAAQYASSSFPPTSKPFFGKNYGFQFMYNPATVAMDYVASPNVDIGMQTSGTEKFNAMGTNRTMSTITFNIIINRMFDMKYYDTDGTLKPAGTKAYGGRLPTAAEQKDIFNKGTMYDVEYLLRTLLGFTLKSFLRPGDTADIGYLGARPIELHLGKSLRYWGNVTGVGLNHVIFNENMIPLFTNVSISFSRLPDYPGAVGSSNSTGAVN